MITNEQLKGVYGEVEAQSLYQEIRTAADYAGFARQFVLSSIELGGTQDDYQITRNALWVLTKATDVELSQLQPLLHDLINLALATANSSVRRLSLNVIERLKMDEDDLRTDFLDFCLDHMADINEYPGIQSLCMKLAYRMATFYPELMGELSRTIEGMEVEYYKPAVISVRNRILKGKMKK